MKLFILLCSLVATAHSTPHSLIPLTHVHNATDPWKMEHGLRHLAGVNAGYSFMFLETVRKSDGIQVEFKVLDHNPDIGLLFSDIFFVPFDTSKPFPADLDGVVIPSSKLERWGYRLSPHPDYSDGFSVYALRTPDGASLFASLSFALGAAIVAHRRLRRA